MDITIPQLYGPAAADVRPFNHAVETFVADLIAGTRPAPDADHDPAFSPTSLTIDYRVITMDEGVLSVLFTIDLYLEGAAHPTTHPFTTNYDLEEARVLELDDLFLPASLYLHLMAVECVAQLAAKGPDFHTEGAAPLPENYQAWNVDVDGLLITFDTYQLAPGAAGLVPVTVPYEDLEPVIDPDGPLAPFV